MAVLSPERKKQRSMIVLLGVILTITFGVVYFGILGREGEVETGADTPEAGEAEEASIVTDVKQVKLNLDLLEKGTLKDFSPYDKLPANINTGRDNPFAPY